MTRKTAPGASSTLQTAFYVGGATLCAALVWANCGSGKSANHKATDHESALPSASQLVVPPDQLRLMRETRDALAYVAAKSASAQELLELFDTAAVKAKAEIGQVRVIEEPKPDRPWFLLAADTRPLENSPEGLVFARFACHPPRMLIRDGDITQLVRGLFLAHELEHANDCLFNNEPESAFLSDDWLLGEMHAHFRVFTILDQWTNGGWKTLALDSQKRRQVIQKQKGLRPEATSFAELPEDAEQIGKLFGDQGQLGKALFVTQLNIDANILNVNIQMDAYGFHDENQTTAHYLEVLRRFYGQHAKIINRAD